MKKPFLRCLRAFLTATVLAAGVCFGVPGVCESPVGMRAEAVETTSDGSSIATGSVHTDTDTTTTSTQEALSTEKDTPATTELPTSANTPTATPSQDNLSDKLPAFLAAGGVIVFVGIVAAVLIIRKKKRDKQKPKMLISR